MKATQKERFLRGGEGDEADREGRQKQKKWMENNYRKRTKEVVEILLQKGNKRSRWKIIREREQKKWLENSYRKRTKEMVGKLLEKASRKKNRRRKHRIVETYKKTLHEGK